jgi:hypothetical protein
MIDVRLAFLEAPAVRRRKLFRALCDSVELRRRVVAGGACVLAFTRLCRRFFPRTASRSVVVLHQRMVGNRRQSKSATDFDYAI